MSSTLSFPLNLASYNVSSTCASYYNGTNLTAPGFITPISSLLAPFEDSFLALTITQGPNQNVSGFAALYNNSANARLASFYHDCYLGAAIYPPDYNLSATGVNATATTLPAQNDLDALGDGFDAPYVVINVNQQLAHDTSFSAANFSIAAPPTDNSSLPDCIGVPRCYNASTFASIISDTVTPECATYYGGSDLKVPAFLMPVMKRGEELIHGWAVYTITQGANQNASAFLDAFGREDITIWLGGCYMGWFSSVPPTSSYLFNLSHNLASWQDATAKIKAWNTPYFVLNWDKDMIENGMHLPGVGAASALTSGWRSWAVLATLFTCGWLMVN